MNRNRGIRRFKPYAVPRRYWSDNEHFADLFNAVLFDGHSFIKAADLQERTWEVSGGERPRNEEVILEVKHSDKLKVNFVILGMDNPDAFPVDGTQCLTRDDFADSQWVYDPKAELDTGVARSETTKSYQELDRRLPVVSICIYDGQAGQERDYSVRRVLDMLEIPDDARSHRDDYKLIMLDASHTNLRFKDEQNRVLFENMHRFAEMETAKSESSIEGEACQTESGIKKWTNQSSMNVAIDMATIV